MNAPRLFRPDEEPAGLAVADVVAAYLEDKRQQAAAGLITPRAVEKARYYLSRFASGLPVSQARRNDLRDWLAQHPEWRSPHTKRDACAQVLSCFRWAADEADPPLLDACPYRRPKGLPEPQPRQAITEQELRQVLHAARSGYRKARSSFRVATWFLWETGCRTSELRALRWEHYDPSRGLFSLPSKSTVRTGELRLLVLPYRAWRLIRFLHRWSDKTGLVFTNGIGRAWTKDNLSRRFSVHRKAAGVRAAVSPYSARHGFCCARLEAGAGARQVADLMGHASTKYVDWYGRGVRTRVQYLREVADRKRDN